MIEYWMGFYDRSEIYGFWAAVEKQNGEFLGWFHFRPREGGALDEPELGYRLVSPAWGRGYATDGSRAATAATSSFVRSLEASEATTTSSSSAG